MPQLRALIVGATIGRPISKYEQHINTTTQKQEVTMNINSSSIEQIIKTAAQR